MKTLKFTFNSNEDAKVVMTTFTEALDYLKSNASENYECVTSDDTFFDAIAYIKSTLTSVFLKRITNIDDIMKRYNCFDVFVNILRLLINNSSEFNFDSSHNHQQASDAIVSQERPLLVLDHLIQIYNYLLPISMKLRLYLSERSRLCIFFQLIGSEKYILGCLQSERKNSITSLVYIINWLSKHAEANMTDWYELNAITSLLKLLQLFNEIDFFVYIIVINVATDNQLDELREIDTIIGIFVQFLKRFVTALNESNLKRIKQNILCEELNVYNEYSVGILKHSDADSIAVTTTGFLQALYRLSINSKMRVKLANASEFVDLLKTIVLKGSEIEIEYCLSILGQLCFEREIARQLVKDDELCFRIRNLQSDAFESGFKTSNIKRICENIRWLFSDYSDEANAGRCGESIAAAAAATSECVIDLEQDYVASAKTEEDDSTQKISISTTNAPAIANMNIIISCNHSEFASRIKAFLEAGGGLTVHSLNVSRSFGHLSSLTHLADSISIVLVCASEKYRQSLFCQTEAFYWQKQRKIIIPLIIQNKYENVGGWLGAIIANKVCVKFDQELHAPHAAAHFEEALGRLKTLVHLANVDMNSECETKNEIPKILSIMVNSSHTNKILNLGQIKEIEKWTTDDVKAWFVVNMFNKELYDLFLPCDGQLLSQIYQLQFYVPDFFFKSLVLSDTKNLQDIATFSLALQNLFNSHK